MEFNAVLKSLKQKRLITVAHCCDVHYPDHDDKALALTYEVYKEARPDVIVVGSDEADFSVLSNFAPDPDANEQTIDVLQEFAAFHNQHIRQLHAAAPDAAVVFIMGNHERRIYNFLHTHAPKLRKTIEAAWIETARAGGIVHWLDNASEVLIHGLLVKHGDRVNEYVTKSMLMDAGFQVSIMAGHVHRLSQFTFAGYQKPVTAVTSGCLCKTVPSYMASVGRKPLRAWQQGTALAYLDTRRGVVWFDNLLYVKNGGKLETVLSGKVLSV